eukprot:169122-Pelagomonas_calceolata.AAC.3
MWARGCGVGSELCCCIGGHDVQKQEAVLLQGSYRVTLEEMRCELLQGEVAKMRACHVVLWSALAALEDIQLEPTAQIEYNTHFVPSPAVLHCVCIGGQPRWI